MSDDPCDNHDGAFDRSGFVARLKDTPLSEEQRASLEKAFEGWDTRGARELLDVSTLIAEECDALKAMLLEKNEAYGNSALDPLRIASRASPEEQILVRIDDKLSRLARGSDAGEDVWLDLLGYIVLLRVARRMKLT